MNQLYSGASTGIQYAQPPNWFSSCHECIHECAHLKWRESRDYMQVDLHLARSLTASGGFPPNLRSAVNHEPLSHQPATSPLLSHDSGSVLSAFLCVTAAPVCLALPFAWMDSNIHTELHFRHSAAMGYVSNTITHTHTPRQTNTYTPTHTYTHTHNSLNWPARSGYAGDVSTKTNAHPFWTCL